MIKTILFDLDGTILPLEGNDFEETYLSSISQSLKNLIEPQKLVGSMWESMKDMIQDKTSRTNEEVFYDTFKERLGAETVVSLQPHFDAYYETDYDAVKEITSPSTIMIEAVRYLKEKGYTLILATNPLFPSLATNKRIEWAGVNMDDFVDVTRFETNHHCKPHLAYYEEIVAKNGLNPEECLMIGNDVEEDMVAGQLGMKTWLIEDNLIHRGSEIICDWRGNREEFLEKLKATF